MRKPAQFAIFPEAVAPAPGSPAGPAVDSGRVVLLLAAILSAVFLSAVFPAAAVGQITTVWALGDGEKVFREDTSHPAKQGNFTWDGKTIRLQGLYNEVLAFQVIAETGPDGAKGVDLRVTFPVNQASGKSIGANTLPYGPDGYIEVFSQHYLHVTDSTAPNWFYGSEAARPEKMKGWIPDALIPSDALPGRGGFPLDIPEMAEASGIAASPGKPDGERSQNQGFWVDLYLPRDRETYPPGVYTGSVEVYESGEKKASIPLEVTLLPHYLPDENAATIWVFSSDTHAYFPDLSPEEIDKMLKFEGHRHRVDMTGGFPVNSRPFDRDAMNAYLPYLDGSAYTPANGYYGPGQGSGEQLFPIGMYGGKVLGNTREQAREQAALWVDWFGKNAPEATYFWYMIDEPTEAVFDRVKEQADWIKGSSGPAASLPTFTTTSYQEELDGYIDIWAGYNGVDLEMLPRIREKGGDHWFYNGNRPRYGSVILEGAAVDLRVNSWILYKYQIPTHFIWHSTAWRHNSQGPKGRLHQNVFRDPLTFINNSMDFGNGDGILFYPGRMPFYPEENRGLNRILPSIRLKNIRRGQQDAVIMQLAEKKVGREKVTAIISKAVPRALSEVGMDEPVPWSEHGDDYDRIRKELLNLL